MKENQIIDKYPLGTLYFYITQGCNLKCRHCWINPKYLAIGEQVPAMNVAHFVECIDQAIPLGLKSVKLTGGEPFLHPRMDQLLDIIYSRKLSLAIESNGTLITPRLARKIKTCENPFISISIDSTDEETHDWLRGESGCFRTAVRGLNYCIESGLKTQVVMSLVKRNRDDIDDMVEFAKQAGCESVKFNIVQPIERGKNIYTHHENMTIEEYIEIGKYVTGELQQESPIRLHYDLPPAFLPLSYMLSGYKHGCGGSCGIKNILGILWNGNISICGIGETVQELVLGNIGSDDLETIWKENIIVNTIRTGFPEKLEGICSNCVFQVVCSGDCPANNYYNTKNIFAPGWFCDRAYEEQLFPDTRVKFNRHELGGMKWEN